MHRRFIATIGLVALLAATASASAADVLAGRQAAQAKCQTCHEADDWEGESAASLQSLISDIVAGKVKHKQKIDLSAADIQNIAAYWGQGKNAGKK